MLVAAACPVGDLIFMEGLRAEFEARGERERGRWRKPHAVLLRTDHCVALTRYISTDIQEDNRFLGQGKLMVQI